MRHPWILELTDEEVLALDELFGYDYRPPKESMVAVLSVVSVVQKAANQIREELK